MARCSTRRTQREATIPPRVYPGQHPRHAAGKAIFTKTPVAPCSATKFTSSLIRTRRSNRHPPATQLPSQTVLLANRDTWQPSRYPPRYQNNSSACNRESWPYAQNRCPLPSASYWTQANQARRRSPARRVAKLPSPKNAPPLNKPTLPPNTSWRWDNEQRSHGSRKHNNPPLSLDHAWKRSARRSERRDKLTACKKYIQIRRVRCL